MAIEIDNKKHKEEAIKFTALYASALRRKMEAEDDIKDSIGNLQRLGIFALSQIEFHTWEGNKFYCSYGAPTDSPLCRGVVEGEGEFCSWANHKPAPQSPIPSPPFEKDEIPF